MIRIDIKELQDEEEAIDYSHIKHLIRLGRKKGHVTMDDIIKFFPNAENDVEKLEETFAALAAAGITYLENTSDGDEPTNDELTREEGLLDSSDFDQDYLQNIASDDTIGLYMKEVSRIPLLTSEEEVMLAQSLERGKMARQELADGNTSKKRLHELILLIEKGSVARDHLINANSRLVISVAKKFRNRGVPFLDLIQEGNIGLMRATKKFDYRRGFKFSTCLLYTSPSPRDRS